MYCMTAKKKDTIERMVIKVPKSVADYFRDTFPHGKRSQFVVKCIMNYKHDQEIKEMEKQLRRASKKRQK